jgi:high-affinity Fe2+/Pb2+ permease
VWLEAIEVTILLLPYCCHSARLGFERVSSKIMFYLQNAEKGRADERTRTADLLITNDNPGVARHCTELQIPRIYAVFSSLVCTVLHRVASSVV